jgi:cobalt/nickel transport system permease protein
MGGSHGGHGGRGFIEKTILGTFGLVGSVLESDEMASRKGLFQAFDPRFKLIFVVVMLWTNLVTRNSVELVVLYAAILFCVALSHISLWFFLKRTWLFVPIFSFCAVVPAFFSGFTPGEPLWSVALFGHMIIVTKPGVASAGIFFLRVLNSVSMSILLIITTRNHILLKTFRIFKVPHIFVMTIGMCYRYIFLLIDIIQKSFLAIKSRVGFISRTATGRNVVTANMANLWLRSYHMHGQVYDAMVARGYCGESHVIEEFKSQPIDYMATAASFFILAGTLWLNHCSR